MLSDKTKEKSYFIDTSKTLKNSIIDTLDNIINCIKSNNETYICHNNFEIWNYSLDNKNLINRYSDKILDIFIHNHSNYLLVINENSIDAINIKNNKKITLIKTDYINNYKIDTSHKEILFSGTFNNTIGLYSFSFE